MSPSDLSPLSDSERQTLYRRFWEEEYKKSGHPGIAQDAARKRVIATEHGEEGLCRWCGGTGNELFSMYRKCPQCDGEGWVGPGKGNVRQPEDLSSCCRSRGGQATLYCNRRKKEFGRHYVHRCGKCRRFCRRVYVCPDTGAEYVMDDKARYVKAAP